MNILRDALLKLDCLILQEDSYKEGERWHDIEKMQEINRAALNAHSALLKYIDKLRKRLIEDLDASHRKTIIEDFEKAEYALSIAEEYEYPDNSGEHSKIEMILINDIIDELNAIVKTRKNAIEELRRTYLTSMQKSKGENLTQDNLWQISEELKAELDEIVKEGKVYGKTKRDILRQMKEKIVSSGECLPKYEDFKTLYPDVIGRSDYDKVINESQPTKHEKFK